MEWLPRTTRAQAMDVLSSQANIGGYKAVILAANEYQRFMPMLMTAAGTVKAARVLILGAGVAGLQAIATAESAGCGDRGLGRAPGGQGANREPGRQVSRTCPSLTDEEREIAARRRRLCAADAGGLDARQAELVHERAKAADIVITTALIPGRPAPVLDQGRHGQGDEAGLGAAWIWLSSKAAIAR